MSTRIIAIVSAVVGLLVTFTVIEGTVAQAVIGAASIIVPATLELVEAIKGHAVAVVRAAEISRPQVIPGSLVSGIAGKVSGNVREETRG